MLPVAQALLPVDRALPRGIQLFRPALPASSREEPTVRPALTVAASAQLAPGVGAGGGFQISLWLGVARAGAWGASRRGGSRTARGRAHPDAPLQIPAEGAVEDGRRQGRLRLRHQGKNPRSDPR